MTMTTKMVQELRERAAWYRQKADALDLAAADFNGHLTHKAKDEFAGKLAKAIGARASTNGHKPHAPATPMVARASTKEEQAARLAVLRAALDGTDRTVKELQALLAEQGYSVSKSFIPELVRKVGGRMIGSTYHARWTLTPKGKTQRRRAKHPNKLDLLKQVLREAGEPLSSKAIVAAYKAAGGRGGLTGIGNYVVNGHLTRNKAGEYGLGPKAHAAS